MSTQTEFEFVQSLSLGSEFRDKDVRMCIVGGVKKFSVVDVIKAVCGNANPRDILSKLRTDYPEIVGDLETFRFPGRGQNDTSIADVETMLSIIIVLPGKRARQYMASAVGAILDVTNPTEKFVKDISERLSLIQEQSLGNQNPLVDTDEKQTIIASRAHVETHIYVRIRLPDEYLKDTNNVRALTMDTLKFGVANHLRNRDNEYNQSKSDNGFFIFSYPITTREEAVIIENILKTNFGHITVGNSRGYIDAKQLADILQVEYDNESYDSYVNLAEELFRYIVRLIRMIWGNKYESKGFLYDINEVVRKFEIKLSPSCQIIDEPMNTDEITYTKKTFKIRDDDSQCSDEDKYRRSFEREQREHATTSKCLSNLQKEYDEITGILETTNASVEK